MFKNFETSKTEVIDITKAWIVISAAFAIVLTKNNLVSTQLLFNFLLSGLTVGIGFLFHELSHKVVAQKYGARAEFRAFNPMLLLALAMSFFGFVFAAPGAVMIAGGHINIKRNGKISIAGPLVNLVLALIFFVVMKLNLSSGLNTIGQYGFFINSWLALFNMIPFGPFDGRKVFVWNKLVWISIVAIAVIFLFIL
ncbi:MAG: site-2 protease family protein [Nanoarchaeota archaeon]